MKTTLSRLQSDKKDLVELFSSVYRYLKSGNDQRFEMKGGKSARGEGTVKVHLI